MIDMLERVMLYIVQIQQRLREKEKDEEIDRVQRELTVWTKFVNRFLWCISCRGTNWFQGPHLSYFDAPMIIATWCI